MSTLFDVKAANLEIIRELRLRIEQPYLVSLRRKRSLIKGRKSEIFFGKNRSFFPAFVLSHELALNIFLTSNENLQKLKMTSMFFCAKMLDCYKVKLLLCRGRYLQGIYMGITSSCIKRRRLNYKGKNQFICLF